MSLKKRSILCYHYASEKLIVEEGTISLRPSIQGCLEHSNSKSYSLLYLDRYKILKLY